MTIGGILLLPFHILDRFNPLNAGANYLLRHAPTFWRASVLKVAWYMIVGHLALWMAGMVTANTITSIPTLNELMVFRTWTWPVAGIITMGWLASIWRTPLIDRRLPQMVSTFLIYAAFFYGLVTLPNAYFAPVSGAVVQLYDHENLETDRRIVHAGIGEFCGSPVMRGQGPTITEVLQRIYVGHDGLQHTYTYISMLIDVMPDCALLVEEHGRSIMFGTVEAFLKVVARDASDRAQEWPSTFDFETEHNLSLETYFKISDAARSLELTGRLDALNTSFAFSGTRSSLRYLHGLISPVALVFAILAAAVLLIVEVVRFNLPATSEFVRRFLGRIGLGRKSRRGLLRRLERKLDRNMARSYPNLWVTRLHLAVLMVVAVPLVSFGALEYSEFVFEATEYLLRPDSDGEIFEMAFGIVYLLFFGFLGVFLMRNQRRYFEANLLTPGTGAQFFSALFMPPFLGAAFIYAVAALDLWSLSKDEVFLASFAASFLVYVAAAFSYSVAFSSLRIAARMGVIVVTFVSLMVMLIVMVDMSQETFVVITLPISLALLALWPAHYFGQLGRITSKSLLVLFLFTSAFFPFLVVMLIDVLDLLENLASMESDIVFYGTMTFGYLAVVWLLRPVISRLQILCIEPQES